VPCGEITQHECIHHELPENHAGQDKTSAVHIQTTWDEHRHQPATGLKNTPRHIIWRRTQHPIHKETEPKRPSDGTCRARTPLPSPPSRRITTGHLAASHRTRPTRKRALITHSTLYHKVKCLSTSLLALSAPSSRISSARYRRLSTRKSDFCESLYI